MNELLKTLGEQPIYVFMFLALAGFFWNNQKSAVVAAVQSEAVKAALALAAVGQVEANRLRDETNKLNERWLHMIETMNERFIMAITGQTGVMTGQAKRLETIDTSLTTLPALATGSAVSAVGANVDIALRILKALDINVDELAKHASNPTAASKDKVDQIADKAEQKTPSPEPVAPAAITTTPKVGDEIPVTGQVTGVVTLTVDTPAVPT